jgi:hypothetical protein
VRAATAAPNSSLSAADSTGEVDKRHCWVAGKTAVRSVLAGAMRSRGETKRGVRCLLCRAEGKKGGQVGDLACRRLEKEGG